MTNESDMMLRHASTWVLNSRKTHSVGEIPGLSMRMHGKAEFLIHTF